MWLTVMNDPIAVGDARQTADTRDFHGSRDNIKQC